ncbi:hypothetical protein IMZ48_26990 [Candidatus Bathyarchaeota archaeon]|nr:hypothetical protein [Candidatus Bathyarchaeota archaeon]
MKDPARRWGQPDPGAAWGKGRRIISTALAAARSSPALLQRCPNQVPPRVATKMQGLPSRSVRARIGADIDPPVLCTFGPPRRHGPPNAPLPLPGLLNPPLQLQASPAPAEIPARHVAASSPGVQGSKGWC